MRIGPQPLQEFPTGFLAHFYPLSIGGLCEVQLFNIVGHGPLQLHLVIWRGEVHQHGGADGHEIGVKVTAESFPQSPLDQVLLPGVVLRVRVLLQVGHWEVIAGRRAEAKVMLGNSEVNANQRVNEQRLREAHNSSCSTHGLFSRE